MAVPQLIIQWQMLMYIENNEQCLNYWLLKVKSWSVFTNFCSKCMLKQIWTWVLFTVGHEKADKLHGKSWSGSPSTAVMPNSIQYVDELISDECRTTTHELCSALSTSKRSVMALTEELGYSKVCVHHKRWQIDTRQGKQPVLIFEFV